MQADDFRDIRYRLPARVQEQGTSFWRIVGAVFTALFLFGLLQMFVAMLVYREVVKEFDRMTSQWEQDMQALISNSGANVFAPPPARSPRPVTSQAQRSRSAVSHLAAHYGPVESRRLGLPAACIGG